MGIWRVESAAGEQPLAELKIEIDKFYGETLPLKVLFIAMTTLNYEMCESLQIYKITRKE